MNSSMTRIPLAIALSSALAFAVGCDTRTTDDRAGMQTADDPAAQTTPPAGTAPADPMAQRDATYGEAAQDRAMADAQDFDDGRDSDQPINDTWITTKVKTSLLADSDVAGMDIEVETVNGVVTLSGQVEQQAQIDQATSIARDIEGVTEVRTAALTVGR